MIMYLCDGELFADIVIMINNTDDDDCLNHFNLRSDNGSSPPL